MEEYNVSPKVEIDMIIHEVKNIEQRMIGIVQTIYVGYTEPEIKGSINLKMMQLHNLMYSHEALAVQKHIMMGKVDKLRDQISEEMMNGE